RLPQALTPLLMANIQSPMLFLLLVNLFLLIVGCFMEALAAMLILIPILAPAAISYGIDPVQFGVIVVLNLIIGTVTPPVGVVLFVVTRIADISFERMARAI
ncbi:TRAP transporter large permease subunit, partial [bacterium]|nr:TRAP transporter large permease subunit [bacterium]